MSKAIDNLSNAVGSTVKTSAGVTISKDNLIDVVSDRLSNLYNISQFFTAIEENSAKLNGWIASNRRDTNLKSIFYYNKIDAALTGEAKRSLQGRFLGALSDTTNALIMILEELSDNVDKFFTEKTVTVYNTKISNVAILGMIENSKMFAEFCNDMIAITMADRNQELNKPERYTFEFLDINLTDACDLMNRVLNNHLSKTFTSALLKYRNGGSDVSVVNAENKPSVQFTKISSEVTENDLNAGAKGLAIFRWFGNLRADRADKKNRKRVALRDQLQSRARLLQLELDGVDSKSPEYQRLVKIIDNYQAQIDRLTQEIDKYENE